MKKLNIFIDVILYMVVAIVLTSAVCSAIYNKPILFSTVKSNSMYPLFQRGDMIILKSVSENDIVSVGDIVIFRAEEGSLSSHGYVVHRIVEIEDNKFITKGDANDYKDPPNKREWIVSKVLTIGNHALKIPLLGYLPLWMENFQKNPYAMPIIAVILAVIVSFSELTGKKIRNKNKKGLEMQLIYFFSGLTISIVMAATMLSTSQRIILPYEVSENSQGVIMGSAVGIIKIGEERQIPLADLSNKGFMPVTTTVTSKDDQLTFNYTLTTLNAGDELKVEANLKASHAGEFNTIIHIGMFYPFLSKNLIYLLSFKNYYLALIVVSLIPGLPLMLYPIIDKSMRKKIIKEIRRKIRRIERLLPN